MFLASNFMMKKKEKILRFRKSWLKKKKNLPPGVALVQIFSHICGDLKGKQHNYLPVLGHG